MCRFRGIAGSEKLEPFRKSPYIHMWVSLCCILHGDSSHESGAVIMHFVFELARRLEWHVQTRRGA